MRWLVLGLVGLAGCGLVEARLGEPARLVGQETPSPFSGLKIVSIEALPVLCPCFKLVAKSPGHEVVISYELGPRPMPTRIKVNGEDLDRSQWHALGQALMHAEDLPDDRREGVQAIAEYFITY